jgi:hypothetical protein
MFRTKLLKTIRVHTNITVSFAELKKWPPGEAVPESTG